LSRRSFVEEPEPLRTRIGRFLTLLFTVFGICFAVIVTQRLSNDALSLIIGVAIGGSLLGFPLVVGVWIWLSTRKQTPPPATTYPPIILQVPQQQMTPSLPMYDDWRPQTTTATSRAWDVIGDDDNA
jgi:hypothetical protein